MPRVSLNQTNFTAGEMSPKLFGRVDIARYNNAVKILENAVPMIHGGAKDRGGTLYVKPTKTAAKLAVLIPFIFNKTQSYILEFGDLYMRVFKDGGQVETSPGVPYEIATPYTEAMLREFDYVQGADTMFLMHQSVKTQRLRRFGHASWDLSPAPFIVEPFDELGAFPAAALTLSLASVGTGRTATAGSAVFLASDVGRNISYGAGIATITAYTSPTVVTCEIKVAFDSTSIASGAWNLEGSPQTSCTASAKDPVGTSITLTLGAAGWRAEDVGKFVKINSGLCKIDVFTSTTIVNATIKSALTSVVAAPALSWSLESSIWGGANGYPRTGALNEQRLILAGSTGFPQSAAGSRTGEYLNFQIGVNDDDGFVFKIAESQDQILHLAKLRQLLAFGPGGEFSIIGGVEKPITPTNIQIKGQAADGCNDVQPVRVGNEIYYVHRASKKLMASTYKFDIDGFDATDASKFAEHIAKIGIIDMAYQREPDSVLWAVLTDGQMASVTIDKEENVTGWARHITDGVFESVATIPVSSGEETWAIVRRTVNGSTVRYVERFAPNIKMDCAITGTSGPGAAIWAGLSHLEAKQVTVVADGVVMGLFTVTGGQITLPRNAFLVEIGLPYVVTIELLPIEAATSSGTTQGNAVRTGKATVRLLESSGCDINGDSIPFRKFGSSLLDRAPVPFTGDKEITLSGWEKSGGSITIQQTHPLPLHVLSVIRKVTIND